MSDPTPDDVLASAKGMGGRVSIARNEVLRLLEAVLPGTVGRFNEINGTRIRAPQGFFGSRESLAEQKAWPVVVAGASLDIEARASGTRFKHLTLVVFVVGGRTETREALDDVWDLAELADLVVGGTQRGWCLPDGRMVWNQCLPQGITQLPGDWEKYSGTAAYYRVDQMGLDLWTPAP